MKLFFSFSLFLGITFSGFCQVKIVKIPEEGFYLNFFYKNRKSDYIKNDSISYLCRTISVDSFYLDKIVNKKIEWTKKYTFDNKKDTIIIYVRSTGSGVVKTKKEYFTAQLLSL